VADHADTQGPRDHGSQSDHVVFFFDDSQELLHEVTRYVNAGLNYDGNALVIATTEHIHSLRAALPQLRLERAEADGRLLALDAEQILAQFMVNGCPDPALFDLSVGSRVRGHLNETGALSVYCELVALLCDEGNLTGALQLEELWNDLQLSTAFSLFCAQPLGDVRAHSGDAFTQICGRHTRVQTSRSPDPETDMAREFPPL